MKRFDAPLALALTIVSCVLTTACGPEAVPDSPDEASVSVEVGPNATGIVVVAFGGEPDDATLATMADTIDGSVFTARPATGHVAGSDGGSPLLEFRSTDVFQPGTAPTVEFDTRRLCDDLIATGITDFDIRLSVPSVSFDSAIVPNQSTSDTTWRVQSCIDSPRGTVVLKPDPTRFWLEFGLIIFVDRGQHGDGRRGVARHSLAAPGDVPACRRSRVCLYRGHRLRRCDGGGQHGGGRTDDTRRQPGVLHDVPGGRPVRTLGRDRPAVLLATAARSETTAASPPGCGAPRRA